MDAQDINDVDVAKTARAKVNKKYYEANKVKNHRASLFGATRPKSSFFDESTVDAPTLVVDFIRLALHARETNVHCQSSLPQSVREWPADAHVHAGPAMWARQPPALLPRVHQVSRLDGLPLLLVMFCRPGVSFPRRTC